MKAIFTRPRFVQIARRIILIVTNATSQTGAPTVTAPGVRLVADSELDGLAAHRGSPRRQACSRVIAAAMLRE